MFGILPLVAMLHCGCRAWVPCSVIHEPGHAAFSHSRWLVLGLGVKVEVGWAWALRQRRGGGGHHVISVDGAIVNDERWPSRHQVDAAVIVDEVGCGHLDVDMTVVDDEVGGRCRCGQYGTWTARFLTWTRWDMDRAVVDVEVGGAVAIVINEGGGRLDVEVGGHRQLEVG